MPATARRKEAEYAHENEPRTPSGHEIRLFRKKNGLTIERMAQLLDVSYQTLHRWETGKTTPTPSRSKALVRFMTAAERNTLQQGEPSRDRREAYGGGIRRHLQEADLRGADLRNADLIAANLRGADLSNADLRGAKLAQVDLSGANLNQADLLEADLQNAELKCVNLAGARLDSAKMWFADLAEANLDGAALRHAILSGVNLRSARAVGADLAFSDLAGADLRHADLSRANLVGADLWGAHVASAVFDETSFGYTTLAHLDLGAAHGLRSAVHRGPSTIDVDTLHRSQRRIPEPFLKGAGLPAAFISALPALLWEQAIEFYSCFISYSHEDKSFARRLHDTLQARGIRCWLDEHQILPGDRISAAIDRGIRLWDRVLLCCSSASLGSPWVSTEIQNALKKEALIEEKRQTTATALVPLNLDGHLFETDIPEADLLRSRNAADFTGWEHDESVFQKQLERVINALRSDTSAREHPPKSKL